jgi:integrase/recombinase XerD
MSRLRDRMQEDLKLAGLCENTQKTYLRCVSRFSNHYKKSPGKLGQVEVRKYLLQLVEVYRRSASTYNVYAAALCFLYSQTLRRPEVVVGIKHLRVKRRLPDVLTQGEVERICEHLSLCMRTIAILAYGSGLRISEICSLRVKDIDSNRMQIHVDHGKGDKARRTLLSDNGVALLRAHWRTLPPKSELLFPGCRTGKPLTREAFGLALKKAAAEAKVNKRVTPHSFRHAFATHLLESGTDLRTLQVLLGHASIRSTVWYLHVTPTLLAKVRSPADRLQSIDTSKPRRTAAKAKKSQAQNGRNTNTGS